MHWHWAWLIYITYTDKNRKLILRSTRTKCIILKTFKIWSVIYKKNYKANITFRSFKQVTVQHATSQQFIHIIQTLNHNVKKKKTLNFFSTQNTNNLINCFSNNKKNKKINFWDTTSLHSFIFVIYTVLYIILNMKIVTDAIERVGFLKPDICCRSIIRWPDWPLLDVLCWHIVEGDGDLRITLTVWNIKRLYQKLSYLIPVYQ